MDLPLHFITNASTGGWVGNPLRGLEEGDFEDAHPFTSLGEAIGVAEYLQRTAKGVMKRALGFLTRQVPDRYRVVTLNVSDPSDEMDDDHQGEMAETPDDEDFEPGEAPDEIPDDEEFEDDIGKAAKARIEAHRRIWPLRWPFLWRKAA